jgi:hypothetical protein
LGAGFGARGVGWGGRYLASEVVDVCHFVCVGRKGVSLSRYHVKMSVVP